LSLFAFSALTLAFQLFTRMLCLQMSGLSSRFPNTNLLIDPLLTPIVESTYLNVLSRHQNQEHSCWLLHSFSFM